jgi:hypothetical protein
VVARQVAPAMDLQHILGDRHRTGSDAGTEHRDANVRGPLRALHNHPHQTAGVGIFPELLKWDFPHVSYGDEVLLVRLTW